MIQSCTVCGTNEFIFHQVLWDDLIAEWQLTPYEVHYIDRQQGFQCTGCGSNLRSMALASAITRAVGFQGTLAEWVNTGFSKELSLLEINDAGSLHIFLKDLPGHFSVAYPETDIMNLKIAAGTYDLIVHSDTLEHVAQPVVALAECRRVLRPTGSCCFTVPVVVSRLSRDRTGLPRSYHGSPLERREDFVVFTEFGCDVWTYVHQAGFSSCTLESIEYPAGLAIIARH